MDPNCAVTKQSSAAEWPPHRKPDSLLLDRKWRLRLPVWLEVISELRETWEYKPKKTFYVTPWSLGLPPQSDSNAAVSVVGTAAVFVTTCVRGSPQHIQSVRKSLTPSIHLSKDIHTGHQVKRITQGSGNGHMGTREDGENQKRETCCCLIAAGLISGVIAARQCTESLTVLCRFKLSALGFDCYPGSLEKGGSSQMPGRAPGSLLPFPCVSSLPSPLAELSAGTKTSRSFL